MLRRPIPTPIKAIAAMIATRLVKDEWGWFTLVVIIGLVCFGLWLWLKVSNFPTLARKLCKCRSKSSAQDLEEEHKDGTTNKPVELFVSEDEWNQTKDFIMNTLREHAEEILKLKHVISSDSRQPPAQLQLEN